MSKSEVISNKFNNFEFDETTIINDLENECYLKNDYKHFFKDEVTSKIEDFSNWFNSIARLYFLRCNSQENEVFIYLLLNLKKKIKFAIAELNRSVSNYTRTYTCNICCEQINIGPGHNVWNTLQNHPHFEELYTQAFDFNYSSTSENISENIENGETSTNGSIVDELCEDLNQASMIEKEVPTTSNTLNDFKFNFVITYDPKIEELLYPDSIIVTARKKDNVSEYTIQRCGVGRGNCLLCPCSLISRGRVFKITPFVVKNHVSGQKHLKHAQTDINVKALKAYHEFWRSQESCYQAHQVHFIPEIKATNVLKCQLCLQFVNYAAAIEHIKGNDHKSKILKIFNSNEGKLNEFYLLDMQVEVYEVNNAKKEEKVKPKSPDDSVKKDSNPPSPPKCVFVKVVAEPSGLNLPPRYIDHKQFFTINGDLVKCKLCKTTFANDWINVRSHVTNSQHKQLSGVPLPKLNFFCEICNVHIKDENAWNDHFFKGPNRHETIPPARKLRVTEYECKTCQAVIHGDELSLSRHISSRKPGRAKEVKLPFSVKKLFKSKQFIEDEGRLIQIEACSVLEYRDRMKECCDDLEHALSGIFPKCKAYPFGSRISGLGNNHSDLDVFMDMGDMYLGVRHQDSQSQEQFVKKATKILKSCKEDFSYVVPIPSARTPIVKLRHNYTNLDCDISFRHGLGVENTRFLRFCIDLQPITQPFILLLKKWSDYCKLNEHITNYGLALMGIFFLQTGGYLLPVKTVRSYNPSQSLIIDGWETLNYTVPIQKMREFVKPYKGSMKQLLRDFFYYFSKFDYENQVVCPLLGNTIPKLLFNENPKENLPPEMSSYIQRLESENSEQFRGLTPFCIQDPFDLSHNLTKACQHGTISKLKAYCSLTYEFMDTTE